MAEHRARFRFLRLAVRQPGRMPERQVARPVRRLPEGEQFALASRMRDSARAVWANLAEGAGRDSDRDLAPCLEVACGSAMQGAADAFLAPDAGHLEEAELNENLDEVETVAAQASGWYRQVAPTQAHSAQRSAFRAPRP